MSSSLSERAILRERDMNAGSKPNRVPRSSGSQSHAHGTTRDKAARNAVGIGAMPNIESLLCIPFTERHDRPQAFDSIESDSVTAQSTNFFFKRVVHREDCLSEVDSSVIQPLVSDFCDGKPSCFGVYHPFDNFFHQGANDFMPLVQCILARLPFETHSYHIAAYEIERDNVFDVLSTNIEVPTSRLSASKPRKRTPCKISLNQQVQTTVVGLSRHSIRSIDEGLSLLRRSWQNRSQDLSTHYVLMISPVKQKFNHFQIVHFGCLQPRVSQSLSNIQNCIRVLRRNQSQRLRKALVVPYRSFVLTRLLQHFIDGSFPFKFLTFIPDTRPDKVTAAHVLQTLHFITGTASSRRARNKSSDEHERKTPETSRDSSEVVEDENIQPPQLSDHTRSQLKPLTFQPSGPLETVLEDSGFFRDVASVVREKRLVQCVNISEKFWRRKLRFYFVYWNQKTSPSRTSSERTSLENSVVEQEIRPRPKLPSPSEFDRSEPLRVETERRLDRKTEQLRRIQQEMLLFRDEKHRLVQDLNTAHAKMRGLQTDNQILQEDFRTVESALFEAQKQFEISQKELSGARNHMGVLKREYEALQSGLGERNGIIIALKQQLLDLESSKRSDVESASHAVDAKLAAAHEQIRDLTNSLYDERQSKFDEKAKRERTEIELSRVRHDLAATEKECNEHRAALDSLFTSVQSKLQDESLSSSFNSNRQKIVQVVEHLSAMEAAHSERVEELNSLRTDYATLQSKFKDTTAALHRKIVGSQAALHSSQREVDKLNSSISEHQVELGRYLSMGTDGPETQLKSLQAEKDGLFNQVDGLLRELSSTQQKCESLSHRADRHEAIEKREKIKQRLRSSCNWMITNTLRSLVVSLKANKEELESQLAMKDAQVKEIEAKFIDMSANLNKVQRESSAFVSEAKQMRLECRELKKKNRDLERRIVATKVKLGNAFELDTNLLRRLATDLILKQDASIATANASLDGVFKRVGRLEKQSRVLRAANDSLCPRIERLFRTNLFQMDDPFVSTIPFKISAISSRMDRVQALVSDAQIRMYCKRISAAGKANHQASAKESAFRRELQVVASGVKDRKLECQSIKYDWQQFYKYFGEELKELSSTLVRWSQEIHNDSHFAKLDSHKSRVRADKLQDQMNMMAKCCSDLDDSLQATRSEYSKLQVSHVMVQNSLGRTKEVLSAREQVVASLEQSRDRLQSQLHMEREKFRDLSAKQTKLEAEHERTRAVLQIEHERIVETYERKLKSMENEKSELGNNHDMWKANKDELRKAFEVEKENLVEVFEKKLDAAHRESAEAHEELNKLRSERLASRTELEKEILRLEKEIRASDDKLQETNAKFDDEQRLYDAAKNALNKRIVELEEKCDKLQRDLERARLEKRHGQNVTRRQMEEQQTAYQELHYKFDEESRRHESRHLQHQKDFENLLDKYRDDAHKWEDERGQLQKQEDMLREEMQTIVQKVSELQERETDLVACNQKLLIEVELHRSDIEERRLDNEDLQSSVDGLMGQNEALSKERAELKNQIGKCLETDRAVRDQIKQYLSEIENLGEEMTVLKTESSGDKALIDSMKSELSEVQALLFEHKDHRRVREEFDTDVQEIRVEFESINCETQNKVDGLADRLHSVSQEVSKLRFLNEHLNSQLSDSQSLLAKKTEENESLSAQVAALRTEMSEKQSDLKRVMSELALLQSKLTSKFNSAHRQLENEVGERVRLEGELSFEIDGLKHSLRTSEQKNGEILQQNTDLATQLSEEKTKRILAQKKFEELHSKAAILRQKAVDKKKELKDTSGQLNDLHGELTRLRIEVKTKQAAVELIREEMEQMKSELQEKVSKAESEVNEVKTQLLSTTRQQTVSFEEVQVRDDTISRLNQTNSELLTDIETHKRERMISGETVEELQGRIDGLQKIIRQQTNNLNLSDEQHSEQIGLLTKQNEILTKQVGDLNKMISESSEQKWALQEALKEFQRQHDDVGQSNGVLQEQLNDCNFQICQLRDRSANLWSRLQDALHNLEEAQLANTKTPAQPSNEFVDVTIHRTMVNALQEKIRLQTTELKDLRFDIASSDARSQMLTQTLEKLESSQNDSLHFVWKFTVSLQERYDSLFKEFSSHLGDTTSTRKHLESYTQFSQLCSQHEQDTLMQMHGLRDMIHKFMKQQLSGKRRSAPSQAPGVNFEEMHNSMSTEMTSSMKRIQHMIDGRSKDILVLRKSLDNVCQEKEARESQFSQQLQEAEETILQKDETIEKLEQRIEKLQKMLVAFHKNARPLAQPSGQQERITELKEQLMRSKVKHHREVTETRGLLEREVAIERARAATFEKELNLYKKKIDQIEKDPSRKMDRQYRMELRKISEEMDGLRHEITVMSNENVTLASVTNSLREIVGETEREKSRLEAENAGLQKECDVLNEQAEFLTRQSEHNAKKIQQICRLDETHAYQSRDVSHDMKSLPDAVVSLQQRVCKLAESDSLPIDLPEVPVAERVMKDITNEKKQHTNSCNQCRKPFGITRWKYNCRVCRKSCCGACAPIRRHSTARMCGDCFIHKG